MIQWDVPPSVWIQGAEAYTDYVYHAIYQLCKWMAPQIENWMKDEAPWTDRTGNARQSLWTSVVPYNNRIEIELSHGVYYGIYLELSNSGLFAIIGPALDWWGEELWLNVEELMR